MRKMILGVGVMLVGLLLVVGLASAEIPHLINFQGKLTDATGTPLTGTYSITFRIYNVPSGGTALWSETQTGVAVSNGIFNVLLGNITEIPATIFEEKDRYLGIKVGTDPEMTPRQRITSVGYAFSADRIKGSNIFPSSGNVGIGTASPSEKLEVNGTVKATSFEGGGVAKVYRSEWFPVTARRTYTKNHGLGAYPDIVQVWIAQNSDGSGWCVPMGWSISGAHSDRYYQTIPVETTANHIVISTQDHAWDQGPALAFFVDKNGTWRRPTSGYCRIVAIKY